MCFGFYTKSVILNYSRKNFKNINFIIYSITKAVLENIVHKFCVAHAKKTIIFICKVSKHLPNKLFQHFNVIYLKNQVTLVRLWFLAVPVAQFLLFDQFHLLDQRAQ